MCSCHFRIFSDSDLFLQQTFKEIIYESPTFSFRQMYCKLNPSKTMGIYSPIEILMLFCEWHIPANIISKPESLDRYFLNGCRLNHLLFNLFGHIVSKCLKKLYHSIIFLFDQEADKKYN